METIPVDLSAELSSFVKSGAAQTGCHSEGEYIAKLVERACNARNSLEDSLINGLESGPPTEWTSGEFADMQQRLLRRNEAGGSR